MCMVGGGLRYQAHHLRQHLASDQGSAGEVSEVQKACKSSVGGTAMIKKGFLFTVGVGLGLMALGAAYSLLMLGAALYGR
jgi:hypothetical protein